MGIEPGDVKVFGICIAKVSSDLKIESLKVYYDPKTMIEPLLTNKNSKGLTASRPGRAKNMKHPCQNGP